MFIHSIVLSSNYEESKEYLVETERQCLGKGVLYGYGLLELNQFS